MYRVIDLDQAPKDGDSYVFLISIAGEKLGFSDVEVAELLKARPTNKTKRGASRGLRGASATETVSDNEVSATDAENGESAYSPSLS